jgi:hypothetical protein
MRVEILSCATAIALQAEHGVPPRGQMNDFDLSLDAQDHNVTGDCTVCTEESDGFKRYTGIYQQGFGLPVKILISIILFSKPTYLLPSMII